MSIKKRFVNSYCISCGRETPVIFDVMDLNDELLYSIPLCRKCSNVFAEDVIYILKKKIESKGQQLVSQNNNNIKLKCKVKQMNIISHRHKKIISNMYKGKVETEK